MALKHDTCAETYILFFNFRELRTSICLFHRHNLFIIFKYTDKIFINFKTSTMHSSTSQILTFYLSTSHVTINGHFWTFNLSTLQIQSWRFRYHANDDHVKNCLEQKCFKLEWNDEKGNGDDCEDQGIIVLFPRPRHYVQTPSNTVGNPWLILGRASDLTLPLDITWITNNSRCSYLHPDNTVA